MKKLFYKSKRKPLSHYPLLTIQDYGTTENLSPKTVLVVEDQIELQNFLENSLGQYYNTNIADNGEMGYAKAHKYLPDLIISDIMMPKLDGIAMCRKTQDNTTTEHIPIILLTAKYPTSSKLSGLRLRTVE